MKNIVIYVNKITFIIIAKQNKNFDQVGATRTSHHNYNNDCPFDFILPKKKSVV